MEVTPADTSSPGLQQIAYEIREIHDLPKLDCFRLLKHVIFAGPRLELCSRWLFRLKNWLAALYIIGIVLAYTVAFLPAKYGRVAVFFGLAELPALAATMISLRYDIIRLTMTTYEFWYIACLNMAFSGATIMNYQDTRALLIVPTVVSALLIALQDANFRKLQFTIRIFGSVAITQILVIMYMNLHLVDQWHTVEVIRYGKHALTSDNIVSNYLAFTSVLLLRNAYRKHRSIRHCRGAVVRCILYRCRVRLVLQNTPQSTKELTPQDAHVTQMRMVPSIQVYDSNQITLRLFFCASLVQRFFAASRRNRLGLKFIGTIGLALTITALIWKPTYLDRNCQRAVNLDQCGLILQTVLSVSSAIATGIFYAVYIGLYQQQLLQKLLTSFDYVLLAGNITIVHVCISDTLAWTPKCVALVSSWMWMIWAISMDALTSDMRQALGLNKHLLIVVMVIFLVLAALLVIEIIFLKRWNLQDRSLFQAVALGSTIQLQVIQVFFSCLLSLLPMNLRIIWRLYTAQHGELILIQAAVEYEDFMLVQKQNHRNPGHKQTKLPPSRSLMTLLRLILLTRVQPASQVFAQVKSP